jgi:hypothetical protein
VKVVQLEGSEGTGPLEQDEQLLSSASPVSASDLSPAQHAAVVYRSGQKRLVRAWLMRSRDELQAVLKLMEGVSELQRSQEASE